MTEMDTETGTQKMEENYLDFLDDNVSCKQTTLLFVQILKVQILSFETC